MSGSKITEELFYEYTDGETEYFAVSWLLDILNGETTIEEVRAKLLEGKE